MIKYPVKIHDIDKKLVIQSDNSIVCEAYSEEKALAIANSLNAMNEFPTVAVGSSWINEVLVPWCKKFFPNHDIHHTKERDCLCCDCADT
jgi:hypothetical protein